MTGGGEVSVRLLAEKLVERGHKVIVLTFDRKKRFKENINGVNVVRYKTFTKKALPLTLIPYIIRAMKKWENSVNIYHVYNVSPLPGVGLYKIFGGNKKIIATLNSYTAFCPIGSAIYNCEDCNLVKRFKCLRDQLISRSKSTIEIIASLPYSILYPLLTKLSRTLEQYIAISETVKNFHIKFGFDEEKIKVIPNFIQYKFNKNMDFKYHDKDFFNILYVGAMNESKGIHILIKAFSRIARKYKDSRLILVGKGRKINDYLQMAKNLDIDNKVTFTGYLNDGKKNKYYSEANVFIHPAIWPEPFGRTLLEAMSFNIPLIVSNVGAPPKIIQDAGLIFENGNVEDLERKMKMIIDDNKLRKKLKSKCGEVLKKYDINYVLDKIVELYKEVLE